MTSACSPNSSSTGEPGSAERPAACGLDLSAQDLEGGFLGGTPTGAADVGIVEVALVAGEGVMLSGRPLLFAGRFHGVSTMVAEGGSVMAFEAQVPSVDDAACTGSVRVALGADIGKIRKGAAYAEATLGEIVVQPSGIDCTAIAGEAANVAVECPQVSIRIGDLASTGTLWLRYAASGSPRVVASLPDWVRGYAASAAVDTTQDPRAAVAGEVRVDGSALPVVATDSEFEGVTIKPAGNELEYETIVAFGSVDRMRRLHVSVPDYLGPGEYREGTFVAVVETVPLDSVPLGASPTREIIHRGQDCRVEISGDERHGSVECALTAVEPDAGIIELSASWDVEAVRRMVGDSVTVRWALGDAYRSEGHATVLWVVNTGLDPGILAVPDVLVGHAGQSDTLRIVIRGFTGDGAYVGDAVDPSLQDVFGDSPNLRLNAQGYEGDPSEAQPWTPIFGACRAIVTDGGRAGSITCPGDASFVDDRTGGPTSLFASWEPA